MANKRLSLQDTEQMKNMVMKGVAPEDIANHFNIAISSVHNYKKRFKQQGVKFPDIRGRRPSGSVEIQSTQNVNNPSTENYISSDSNTMNFVVNGVSVHVSAKAKNVNISKDTIEINF
jgi:flagellar capping protein FliD